MLDRWRLAIVLALFGFLASGALMAHVVVGNYAEMDPRWAWIIPVACPAQVLIALIIPEMTNGSPSMLLMIGQTVANAAIWFCVGALLTKIVGR